MTHCVCAGVACPVRICRRCGRIFLAYAAEEFFGTGILEAEGLRTVDALIVAGHHLELVRQGDFVVAVEAVDHGKVNAELIEYVGV